MRGAVTDPRDRWAITSVESQKRPTDQKINPPIRMGDPQTALLYSALDPFHL